MSSSGHSTKGSRSFLDYKAHSSLTDAAPVEYICSHDSVLTSLSRNYQKTVMQCHMAQNAGTLQDIEIVRCRLQLMSYR